MAEPPLGRAGRDRAMNYWDNYLVAKVATRRTVAA
jgi:hypothetical protein